MKKLENIFFITMVILFINLAVIVYFYFEKDANYKTQPLGISLEKFKSNWGNPDKQIIHETDIVLFYNLSIIDGNKYVFKFDKQTKKLKSKFYDD